MNKRIFTYRTFIHKASWTALTFLLVNGTCTGETLHFDASALVRNGELEKVTLENGNIVLQPTPDIRGIYALKQSFTDREKGALKMDWIDGMSIRATWKDIEPEKDVYNWAVFDEVVKYVRDLNEKEGTTKTVQLRIMDGIWSPLWLKDIGVQYISYVRGNKKKIGGTTTMSHPVPIDNPVLFDRLRLLYRTAALRYQNDQDIVKVIHGTWLGGYWSEIAVPKQLAEHKRYTNERMQDAMRKVIDIYLEEVISRGYVAELPFSGIYDRRDLDVVPLGDYVSEKLGTHSGYFFANDCGVGRLHPESHARKLQTLAQVWQRTNCGLQMVLANNQGKRAEHHKTSKMIFPLGDYRSLLNDYKRYRGYYLEIYSEDIYPNTDTSHYIVEACEDYHKFLDTLPMLRERRGRLTCVIDLKHENKTLRGVTLLFERDDDCGVSWKMRRYNDLAEGVKWGDKEEILQEASGRYLAMDIDLMTLDCRKTPRISGMELVCDSIRP